MRSYLDHAATSPLRASAVAAMVEAMGLLGNPSALHASGRAAKASLEDSRESIAADLGAHPTEVVLTSGGSEADSIAVLGTMGSAGAIVSAVEHPAVLGAVAREARIWPVTGDGLLGEPPDGPADVVSVMMVNNETGVLGELGRAARLARERGALLHTDAVQAVVHVGFAFGDLPLDLASVSAHKLGGPVGIGALLVRRGVEPAAIGLGGGQERKVRSGTQPVVLAAGFAAALREATRLFADETARYARWQADVLAMALAIPGASSATAGAPSSPHIVNVTFAGVRADDLLFLLDREGIDASVGSACRAGVHQPSEVLLAMGRTPDEAAGSVRFSFGHTTTNEDVAALLRVLPDAVVRARSAW